MKKGYVYYLKCPEKKCPRYIGQTMYPAYRLSRHLSGNFSRNDHKSNWLRHLQTNNRLHLVQMIIIEEIEQPIEFLNDTLLNIEKFWIKEFQNAGFDLVNSSEGGKGCKGYKHTIEAKEKISRASVCFRKNHTYSDAHKRSISKSLLGNQRRKGKFCTEEQKRNISEGRKGISAWNRGKKVKYSDEQLLKQKKGVQTYFFRKRETRIKLLKDAVNEINSGISEEIVANKLQMNIKKFQTQLTYYGVGKSS